MGDTVSTFRESILKLENEKYECMQRKIDYKIDMSIVVFIPIGTILLSYIFEILQYTYMIIILIFLINETVLYMRYRELNKREKILGIEIKDIEDTIHVLENNDKERLDHITKEMYKNNEKMKDGYNVRDKRVSSKVITSEIDKSEITLSDDDYTSTPIDIIIDGYDYSSTVADIPTDASIIYDSSTSNSSDSTSSSSSGDY